MKVKVTTLDNKAAGDMTLADEVFAVTPRADIVAFSVMIGRRMVS